MLKSVVQSFAVVTWWYEQTSLITAAGPSLNVPPDSLDFCQIQSHPPSSGWAHCVWGGNTWTQPVGLSVNTAFIFKIISCEIFSRDKKIHLKRRDDLFHFRPYFMSNVVCFYRSTEGSGLHVKKFKDILPQNSDLNLRTFWQISSLFLNFLLYPKFEIKVRIIRIMRRV